MTEISTAFGPSCVSYDTVRRWKKKFESGVESIKNAPKSGRPKSASRKEIVSKIKEIIEGDARFTVRDIARKVGISLSTVHLILKKHLKVRKISARWVPHLLTDEQNRQQVKVAKKLLQMFPKYDKKQFANVVTGDETWVHYFEPVRKVSNKIWATKQHSHSHFDLGVHVPLGFSIWGYRSLFEGTHILGELLNTANAQKLPNVL